MIELAKNCADRGTKMAEIHETGHSDPPSEIVSSHVWKQFILSLGFFFPIQTRLIWAEGRTSHIASGLYGRLVHNVQQMDLDSLQLSISLTN